MSKSNRIIRNTIYLYAKSIISMTIMLFVTRIVLHSLGVIDYGIYNVIAGSIAILGFLRNSLAITMQRFLNHYQGEGDIIKQEQVFNIGIVFHWSAATLLVFLFIILGFYLFDGVLSIPFDRLDASKIVYLCLVINTFITVISAPYDATITSHENMLFYSIVGIVESIAKLMVALFIDTLHGDRLIIYSVLMMGVPAIEVLTMRIYCKLKYRECTFRPFSCWDSQLASNMINFAGWSLVGASTNVISNHGANLALNHYFGAAINAVVGIANQIQGVLAVLLTGMLKSLTPVIFKSEGTGNINEMLKMSMLGCKYSTMLFSFLAIPVFIQAPSLLQLWLGEVPEWTTLFVRLQILRALFEQLGSSMMNPLNATSHVKVVNIAAIFYNITPLFILISMYQHGYSPFWHYIIMIIFLTFGQNFIIFYLCYKYFSFKFTIYIKKVLVPCLITIAVSFLFGLFSSIITTGIIGIILTGVCTSITFIIVVWLVSDINEKTIVLDKIKKYI